ncbi:MAG: cell envelope integrity protein TolA [bacterium]|nr:cell envelope integrity protein TolA [bacterium]
MTAHTLPSGQGHHFREREFKRSFLVSVGIHIVILVAAGSVTLFRMTGTTYSPTYTVDLVTLPPSPASRPAAEAPQRSPARTTAVEAQERKPDRTVAPAKEPPTPDHALEEIRPAGGDEAARLERRRRIVELEQEARRLYESYASDPADRAGKAARPDEAEPETGTAGKQVITGGGGQASDLRFRAYYDQIWAQIRASWVLPEGVTAGASLLTVVGIRISPMGDIQQYWVEKKSGNPYYDQSAIRAIMKKPLPPLPENLADGSLEVGVNFRYPE